MRFNSNPYYNPEDCGLEIFDQIDTARNYEYNMFVIWKKIDDGTLWWDSDSGCSCPSPFDNNHHGHDLKPITLDLFNNFENALNNHYNISFGKNKKMKRKVKEYLKGIV